MPKTYACSICGKKFNRSKIYGHIDKVHQDEVPEGMTTYQFAYDIVNNHPDHHKYKN